MISNLDSVFEQVKTQQKKRQANHLWRTPSVAYSQVAPENNFSTNDYLGLSQNPALIRAYQDALTQWGTGSGGSPLVTGYATPHLLLEEKLADWLGFEKALLFNSGFVANQGTLSMLKAAGLSMFLDKDCHASLLQGARQQPVGIKEIKTGIQFQRFQHNNPRHLQQLMASAHDKGLTSRCAIVTESVFSMDGSRAPLAKLIDLKTKQSQAGLETFLIVDDAHGIGAYGPGGRGAVTNTERAQVDLYTATFGKALGQQGAFVAGKKLWVEQLIQAAPEYIYSTSMSAAQAYTILKSIELVESEPHKQADLQAQIDYFVAYAKQLELPLFTHADQHRSAIQALILYESDLALQLSAYLAKQGFACVAIRPPTVPKGQARLRITLTLAQTRTSIKALLEHIATFLKEPVQ